MKYVRTKDTIIPYFKGSPTGKLSVVVRALGKVETSKAKKVFDEIVLKEADTITELCDLFIILDHIHPPCFFVNFKEAMHFIATWGCDIIPLSAVKGAIWTDKGLIYIAKINEKGKWELL